MRFEWDENKNRANQKKHGITFEVASLVFYDENRLEEYDEWHSDDEERYRVIGIVGDVLSVICTDRPQNDAIRIISARLATKEERIRYLSIVTMTSEEIRRVVTPERIEREIEEARKIPFVYDPECPPLTKEQLKKFHRANSRHTAS